MKRFIFLSVFASIICLLSAQNYCADVGAKIENLCVDVSPDVSVLPAVTADVVIAAQNYNLLPSVVAVLPEISYDLRCFAPCKMLFSGLKADSKGKGFADINYNQRYSYQKQFM
ncbi:MAG: hypothetical protein LBN95_05975 [Prevotellaceae bacterium]|nr:hypothetical protein [Prevotellaceae bacterium]